MAYAATAEAFPSSVTAAPRMLALQRALVWLVGASGAIVFIEPSPYELVTLLAAIIFFATGLRLRLVFMPLLLLLFLVNLGYSIGAIPVMDKPAVANWVATSWYMAMTVVFLAMVFSEDTSARLEMLRRGLITGALVAAAAGIAGYFNVVPGQHDLLTLYGRARGTFKDPNVLAAFLILPALFVLQSLVSSRLRLRSMIAMGIIMLAILLAFSRAAWGGVAITSAFMLGLMVLTSQSRAQRSRIIVTSVIAVAVVVMLVTVLLSVDFDQRIVQTTGEFGSKLRRGPIWPLWTAYPRGQHGSRPSLWNRAAAIPSVFPGGYAQFLSKRLHVRRLACRSLLRSARVHHGHHWISPRLCPCAMAANLSGDFRRVSRDGRRRLHH